MTQIRRGEIWMANLSPTVGREQSGSRPVLIVSSDYFNQGFADLVYAIPVTSKNKNIRSHVAVNPPEGGLTLQSFVMCEAMRSVSKHRLIKPLGNISAATMSSIESNLKILLEL